MLTVCRVVRAVLGNLLLVLIADREQHRLGIDQVTAPLAVIFEDTCLDDRIDRARLLAKAAEYAFGEIDVVARGAAGAIVARPGLQRDRQRPGHPPPQPARKTAVPPRRIKAQRRPR